MKPFNFNCPPKRGWPRRLDLKIVSPQLKYAELSGSAGITHRRQRQIINKLDIKNKKPPFKISKNVTKGFWKMTDFHISIIAGDFALKISIPDPKVKNVECVKGGQI